MLPLLIPVRVLPGSHTVHILKEGFRPFETQVDVALKETRLVEATLEPLAVAGRMRIDDAALAGAQIVIDGAPIGIVPWEGTLAPGHHWYLVRKGDQGCAPKEIIVVKGQTVLGSAVLSPLGPEIRVRVDPATAHLFVDNVFVGLGRWRGRLPRGYHQLTAREQGYFKTVHHLASKVTSARDITVRLRVDEDHPRWGVGEVGTVWLGVFGGPALASSLGSDAERSCERFGCTDESLGLGFLAGARLGFEFPMRLSLELAGGYFSLSKQLTRVYDTTFSSRGTVVPAQYEFTDDIRVSGPFVALGTSYRWSIDETFELRTGALVGALFTRSRDNIAGTAAAGTKTIPTMVHGSDESVSAVGFFVMPEVRLGLRFGDFDLGLGLAAAFSLLEGPAYETGDVEVLGDGCPNTGSSTAIDCAQGTTLVAREVAYGPMLMWVPSVSAGYAF